MIDKIIRESSNNSLNGNNFQVAFAKTHKTGSSTLQNIFFRFGVEHNLTFALHPYNWMFSLKESFQGHNSIENMHFMKSN